MRVLHLANDFSGSSVYKELCMRIDAAGVKQTIYTAIRDKNLRGKNRIDFNCPDSSIHYNHVLDWTTKLNYYHKIRKLTRDVECTVDLDGVSVVHAHTWFSDGGVAYELKKRCGLPYVVTVRNTDVNVYLKFLAHTWEYGLRILREADRIVFLTPVYFNRVIHNRALKSIYHEAVIKSNVICNGIDDFWIQNIGPRIKIVDSEVLRLIYVGKFNRGKNVRRLIEAVNQLNKSGLPCFLTLVGGGGNDNSKILEMIDASKNCHFVGTVDEKMSLMKLFRMNHIFVMPSMGETFGLVYIEALSQGLPIVYTLNDGVDGLYPNVGEGANCRDVSSISGAIRTVFLKYESYSFCPRKVATSHDWSQISMEYLGLYNKIVRK